MYRPTSVTVFGILNLLFAAWGLVGAAISAVMFLVPQPQGLENPVLLLIFMYRRNVVAAFQPQPPDFPRY